MTISFNYYVDIISVVGGSNNAALREYILRIFTTNDLLPPKSFIEMTQAQDVATYFGSTSVEYLRSLSYFSFISKLGNQPNKISFARWVDADVAPMIFGKPLTTSPLSTLQAISDGSFNLTIAGTTHTVGPLDFTSATSLADIATTIQTKIHTFSGTMWTASTVTYNSLRTSFNFVGGTTGNATISVAVSGTGTDITNLIGWNALATYCNGSVSETIQQTITNSINASNNFGSFLFIPDIDSDTDNWISIGQLLPTYNNQFMYLGRTTEADSASVYSAAGTYAGLSSTKSEDSTQYPEQIPAVIFASTDYSGSNTVQNYMYQMMAGVSASVTDTTTAQTLDAIKTNYYGVTQTAGQYLSFYQRGQMFGTAQSPAYMNIYANEIWFKDAAGVALINMQLALPKISANSTGRSQILAILQGIINQALLNGTISVGKPLNDRQKLYVTNITGDNSAWQQVQNIGYWFNVVFQLVDTEYQAFYTVVYSKDDVINKINGKHILI